MCSPDRPHDRARAPAAHPPWRQGGLSLLELTVCTLIGLLIILMALGTLLGTRATSAQISELTQLQQQASFALRALGMQIRQAGSVDIERDDDFGLYLFRDTTASSDARPAVLGHDGGRTGNDRLAVSTQPANDIAHLFSDCLGDPLSEQQDSLSSTFSVGRRELRCLSSKSESQGARGLVRNVADFQLHYRVAEGLDTRRMNAIEVEAAGLWRQVRAVEVCLDLAGDMKEGDTFVGSYMSCRGVDRSLGGRMHLVTHAVITIRTPGS